MQATGECTQLLQRGPELGIDLRELGLELARIPFAREPEREPDRQQVLLRAIVQIALDPPALRVAGRHDPPARGANLASCALSSACRRAFSKASRAAADAVQQLGVLEQ